MLAKYGFKFPAHIYGDAPLEWVTDDSNFYSSRSLFCLWTIVSFLPEMAVVRSSLGVCQAFFGVFSRWPEIEICGVHEILHAFAC